MLEVHDKPWIREAWEQAGLINSYDAQGWDSLDDRDKQKYIRDGKTEGYIITPVWRFEISIKSEGKDIINLNTGQLFRIDLSYLTTQNYIEKLFYVYASKYLDFRESTGQSEIRNYPKMCIFEVTGNTELKPIKINKCADTGRTEKIAANRLQKLATTYSDLTTQDLAAINAAVNFLYEISGMKRSEIERRQYDAYIGHLAAFTEKRRQELDYFEFLQYAHSHRLNYSATATANYIRSLNECLENVTDDMIFEQNSAIGLYE